MGKKQKGILKRILKVFAILLLLFISIILFIRSQWGQDIIVSKVVNYVSKKTNTTVEIDRLFLTFSGNLYLEGLYLEDIKGDTLIYSKILEANVPLSPLVFGSDIELKSLIWDGVKANISRAEKVETFNFNFLLEAFAATDTVTTTQASAPVAFTIGEVSLSNFDVRYKDGFLGIESAIKLGKLQVDIDEMVLESMKFKLENVMLYDTDITYKQTKPFPEAEDSTATQLPYIAVENFKLEQVTAQYNSIPDQLTSSVKIGQFNLDLETADLANNVFTVNELKLNNSTISLLIENQNSTTPITEKTATNSTKFEWPNYIVQVAKIDLNHNNINLKVGQPTPTPGEFNPSDIAISNLNFTTESLSYKAEQVKMSLKTFSFKEQSGFQLRNLAFNSSLNATSTAVSDLELKTNRSIIHGDASIKYNSIQELLEAPENSAIAVSFPEFILNLDDAYYFQTDLAQNETIKKAASKPFTGNLNASGSLLTLAPTIKINWGEHTQLTAKGELYNLMNPDALSFDFKTLKATSIKKDILTFISETDLGISIPKTIQLDAIAIGSTEHIKGNIALKIPEGTAKILGEFSAKNSMSFSGTLSLDNLRLDQLLKNNEFGGISMTMDLKGSGNSLNSLNADLTTNFTQLDFKDYDFSNLNLSGKIVRGKGVINADFKDQNLNLEANAPIHLDSINSNLKLNLNLIGADLYALGITQENIKVGTKLNARFSGNLTDFELNTSVLESVAVYDNEQYHMDAIDLKAIINTNSSKVNIDSDFLTGQLNSNGSPEMVYTALQKQFEAYFTDSTAIDTTTNPIVLSMNLAFRPTPILTEVFLKDVDKLDTITMKANFDASAKKLNAVLFIPSASYNGSTIDSLSVLIEGDATDLNLKAGFSALSSDPILIKKTVFEGTVKNNALLTEFTSFDDGSPLAHIATEVRFSKDTTRLHINPSGLIFNRKNWTIPEDNTIAIGENILNFKNIRFTKENQELSLSNTIEGIDSEHFGITFNNFKLQTFLSLLNPDEALASGNINGSFVIENPFEASGIIADFKINELKALQNPLGNLKLKATSTSNTAYDFDLTLKDGGIDLDLTGDYTAAKSGAKLNLDLELNKVSLKNIEAFSKGAITNSEGFISGSAKVHGTTTNPEYEGVFNFKDAVFNVAELNSVFKITDEKLKINTSGLYLDNFEINDSKANSFVLNGTVLTDDFTNPSFDLSLKADAFQVINSTKEDNELFYGQASMDADVKINGSLSLPVVTGSLKVRKITDITYVVPESQLDVEEREGIVIFVNQENPDAILTRNDEEETSSLFKGYKVNTVLEIADDAIFNVIIDKKTGDNLQVSGDAALNFSVASNGTMNLSGRYELKDGHYETSLYNLVKRKFDIKPGSTITWLGSPTDAKLDVTAIYNVEASASPLMSSVTSSEDASVIAKYQQVLPFMVYLNVDGQLLTPEISFNLDMPEDSQGSLSGAVYSQVQQLNDQESELNKQVFSLLTLNRFFPTAGSDGSSGGTATIARNNVNKVLSGQLNTFSNKLLGNTGFDLDFDLDSFTDYQGDSPQDRTQLNINAQKKLFDNRLIVTAGSAVDVEGSAQAGQSETPIIGNVSLEYLLSEDGRYRLKGFRKNEYQNVIDGQLIITGVALIFNREFNSFSELFNPLKKDTEEKKTTKENK
ncbi:translocation/assembly module TamB domain-containing protein [Cellulophaga baltica]|uniref:translocation/assembly module TamB domain-containing protein n=1 Tax=Cellulophaga baltica TaxID=76594 RepID=UPI0024944D17|nr:translocation/assembly module TamB domain-containing protein [Cellulophaga baltica]